MLTECHLPAQLAKASSEGVAAFLAHLTARAVEARPADASVALTELQRLQSTLAVSDWQYRLPPGRRQRFRRCRARK